MTDFINQEKEGMHSLHNLTVVSALEVLHGALDRVLSTIRKHSVVLCGMNHDRALYGILSLSRSVLSPLKVLPMSFELPCTHVGAFSSRGIFRDRKLKNVSMRLFITI